MFSVAHLVFYFNLLCVVPLCLSCFSGGSNDIGKRPLTKKEAFVVEEVDRMLNQVLNDIKEYGDHIKSENNGKGNSKEEDKDYRQDFPSKEGNQPISFPTDIPKVTSYYFNNDYKPQKYPGSSGSSGFSEPSEPLVPADGSVLKESKGHNGNLDNSGAISPRNDFQEK